MSRTAKAVALLSVAWLSTPAAAYADTGATGSPLRIGLSLVGLVVAVYLLIEALGVRRVASGGAIADRISYVILAILCLSGSALAQWTQNFVQGVTQDHIQLASEVLVIVAMALLAAYFYTVRTALQRFLTAMTGEQSLMASASHTTETADEGEGVDA